MASGAPCQWSSPAGMMATSPSLTTTDSSPGSNGTRALGHDKNLVAAVLVELVPHAGPKVDDTEVKVIAVVGIEYGLSTNRAGEQKAPYLPYVPLRTFLRFSWVSFTSRIVCGWEILQQSYPVAVMSSSEILSPAGPFDCHCEERSDVAISLRLNTRRQTTIATPTRLPRCARNDRWGEYA